jgi:hypothetical protein
VVSAFDNQIILSLRDEIASGDVEILRDQRYYQDILLASFPNYGRIDWTAVPGASFLDVGRSCENWPEPTYSLLKSLIESGEVHSGDVVIYTGDSCENDFLMLVSTFLKCCTRIVMIPDHHYLYPLTGEWCLNCTFEGYLYFGKAPREKMRTATSERNRQKQGRTKENPL